jgi:hypothetical protein
LFSRDEDNDDIDEKFPVSTEVKNPMKIIMLLSLVIVGCILATGCAGQMKNAAANNKTANPTITFTPFSNATSISTTISNSTVTSGLKGLLKISAGGWIGEFPVSVDKMSVGVLATKRPITLMIEEGNHTIEVCCGTICEQENVTIQFGKQRTIDFSEQLQKNCLISEPIVRIIGYYLNGDQITVNVEFINPTTETLTMSADISCGYSYIESRSYNRVGNSATGHLYSTLKSGDRITQILKLNLASGSSYIYDIPTITQASSK